jgi:pyruvate kinase
LPHPEIIEALLPGAEVLLDDGKLKLEVTDNNGHSVETVAVNGGELSDRKGVSVPGVILPINAITDKDMADIEILRKIDADWLAVSFVQTARDIALAREIAGPNINILAKIEKPAAVDHIDSILESADAIMVARGDLGVEIPFESVPHAQKLLINAARAHNKPCIVATQMLESMITCHRPTRAEVSDVACAVLDGADAVMLSAETASGKYPVEAVTTMDKIVTRAERDRKDRLPAAICNANHIAEAVSVIASRDNVRAIAVFTETGNSVNIIAAARPDANIMALTTDKRVGMKLCMTWGAIPVIVNETFEFSQAIQIAQKNIAQRFDIEDGQEIIVVAGVPPNAADQINLIHIFQVDRKAVH